MDTCTFEKDVDGENSISHCALSELSSGWNKFEPKVNVISELCLKGLVVVMTRCPSKTHSWF